MNWLLSHLTLIGGTGLLLIVLSFLRLSVRWPKKALFWPGLVLCIFALVGFGYIAISPPGLEDTVDVDNRPQPTPRPVDPLASLRLSWDSTAYPGWPVAELLASVSDNAYLTPVDAKTSFRKLGFDGIETFADASMIGYVISCGDSAVIAFRGTDDKADWFANLDTLTTRTPQGDVHKGFFKSYQRLKPQIIALLGQSKPKHLWITGHSLGGALALVCAYDLVENEKLSLDGVITFGQPMVAHKQLAECLGEALLGRYAHFVNDNDIVARVAPGYFHCGSLVWFTKDGVKQSKPKRRIVGATGAEKMTAAQGDAAVPVSDAQFERMKADLRKTDANDSVKHRIVGAPSGEGATSVEEDELAPLSEEQFKQVKADLRDENSPPARSPDGKLVVKGNTPWLRDHSMKLYIEKIHTYFGKTEAK